MGIVSSKTFPSKPFRSTRQTSDPLTSFPIFERIGVLYRRKLVTQPFLFFGLPFISIMVMSSFLLTPATALRYERHDRMHSEISKGEALSLGLGDKVGADGEKEAFYNPRRRTVTREGISEKDEYYVSFDQLSLACNC